MQWEKLTAKEKNATKQNAKQQKKPGTKIPGQIRKVGFYYE